MSATATRFGLSRGLLGLQYDQINESESVWRVGLLLHQNRLMYGRSTRAATPGNGKAKEERYVYNYRWIQNTILL